MQDTNIKMYKNDTYKIDVSKYSNINFKSENNDIVVVDSDGVVTAKEVGLTKIVLDGEKYNSTSLNVEVESRLEKVYFDAKKIIIEKDSPKNIKYNIEPLDAKIYSVNWINSNPEIIKIENNTITGIKSGTSRIKVVLNDSVEDYFDVDVIVKPKKISIVEKNINLFINESKKLNVKFEPSDTTEQQVTWKIGNNKIAKIDKKGNLVALSKGKTYVEVTTKNNIKARVNIEVKPIVPSSVKFSKKEIEVYSGNEFKLDAKVLPDNAENKSVKYSSSNSSVVSIVNNRAIAHSPGTAIITASTFNNKKATLKVNVKSNTYNKTAIFFGDSITHGKNKSWANYIDKNYDLKSSTNAGKSGWFISNYMGKDWIVDNVKKYSNNNYNYVILHGGVNDIYRGAPLGTYDLNDFSGNYDVNTFLGGLETYIYTAKKQWPHSKLGYIVNYQTPNGWKNLRLYSAKYFNELKKVLNKWNVKYIDLYYGKNSFGVPYSEMLKMNTYKYTLDGVHITEDGYKIISPEIFKWMNEKLNN